MDGSHHLIEGIHRRSLWQLRIRARLGDLEQAVRLLRQAHAEGQPIAASIRMDPDLEPLRAYPAFRELIRPRS
jgi:hypothetical protein